jgi:hypothetical protein
MFIFEVPAGKPNKGETMNHKLEAKRVGPSVLISDELMKRISQITAKYQSMQPESDEIWESGYVAALDLIVGEIEVAVRASTQPAFDEDECRHAYENTYHKVRAEVTYDDWLFVWKKARAPLSQPASVQGVVERPFPLKMADLVNEAHRRILAALPEDEPDCVPDWVCELLITLGYEQGHMEARASQPAAQVEAEQACDFWRKKAIKLAEELGRIKLGMDAAQPQEAGACTEYERGFKDGQEKVDVFRRALQAAPSVPNEQAVPAVPDIKEMVNRFLGWRLPQDFHPDCGISFDGRKDDEWNKNKTWPIGTNLLTADQARAMFEHCLQYKPHQAAPAGEQETADTPTATIAGDLSERIKQKVMGRLELRGLLTDLTRNAARILGYELLSDLEAVLTATAPSAPSVPDDPSEIEELIACLGDDAAKLRQQDPDDEMAQIMEDAARKLRELDDALFCAAAPAPPVGAGVVPELTDDEIVKVLASLGIDANKSKYGFPELQVGTNVPGIRKIVSAYIAAAPAPSVSNAKDAVDAIPEVMPERVEEAIMVELYKGHLTRTSGPARLYQAMRAALQSSPPVSAAIAARSTGASAVTQWADGSPPAVGWWDTKARKHQSGKDYEIRLWWNGHSWRASPNSPADTYLHQGRQWRDFERLSTD